MKISMNDAFNALQSHEGKTFLQLLRHGTMSLEIYQPKGSDLQQPHLQDEVYIIISGRGTFQNGSERYPFEAGDFLFVPAGVEHRFIDFTEDFMTWVVFYGAAGGEAGE